MRFSTGVGVLLACGALAADAKRLSAFKRGKTVSEADAEVGVSMFAYKGYPDGTGTLRMAVAKTGEKMDDAEWASLRTQSWYPTQTTSPMAKAGYNEWRPTLAGLRFRNPEGVLLECLNGDSRDSLTFDCQHNVQAMLEVKSKAPVLSASDTYTYDDNQKGELWIPADNGVPYGWNRLAESFGFPYFTVTPAGYLGCYKLENGMCSMTPDRFQTTQFQPKINLPQGSIERTDSQPQRLSNPGQPNPDDARIDPSEVTNDAPLIDQ